MNDPRDVLGVAPGASAAEVRRAYLQEARRVHPDAGGSDAAFRRVEQAYRDLRDHPSSTARTQTRPDQAPPPPPPAPSSSPSPDRSSTAAPDGDPPAPEIDRSPRQPGPLVTLLRILLCLVAAYVLFRAVVFVIVLAVFVVMAVIVLGFVALLSRL